MKYPPVLISTINYKKFSDTIECMNSIKKITYPEYELVVVDNCSRNESVKRIKSQFPEVKLIESDRNLGFAGGNNLAVEYGLEKGYEYILLLNNDTTVRDDFLERLLDVASGNEDVGIVGATILSPQSEKILFRGAKINWLNVAATLKGNNRRPDEPHSEPDFFHTGFVTGACMLIKSEVFKKIGLMREDYFMYLEDLDFCAKAGRHFKLAVSNKSVIYHNIGSSTGGIDSPLSTYYVFRNKLYFIKDNYGFWGQTFAYVYYLLYSLIRRYTVWIIKGKFSLIKAHLSGVRDFIRGRRGIMP